MELKEKFERIKELNKKIIKCMPIAYLEEHEEFPFMMTFGEVKFECLKAYNILAEKLKKENEMKTLEALEWIETNFDILIDDIHNRLINFNTKM